jgi:hypothetical protein
MFDKLYSAYIYIHFINYAIINVIIFNSLFWHRNKYIIQKVLSLLINFQFYYLAY